MKEPFGLLFLAQPISLLLAVLPCTLSVCSLLLYRIGVLSFLYLVWCLTLSEDLPISRALASSHTQSPRIFYYRLLHMLGIRSVPSFYAQNCTCSYIVMDLRAFPFRKRCLHDLTMIERRQCDIDPAPVPVALRFQGNRKGNRKKTKITLAEQTSITSAWRSQ